MNDNDDSHEEESIKLITHAIKSFDVLFDFYYEKCMEKDDHNKFLNIIVNVMGNLHAKIITMTANDIDLYRKIENDINVLADKIVRFYWPQKSNGIH